MDQQMSGKPRVQFSHLGVNVQDLGVMERFYTQVMGFTVTDRGKIEDLGLDLIFMSMDPVEHHQFVLCSGRPEALPPAPEGPFFQGIINQISFRVAALEDLRMLRDRLREAEQEFMVGTHGIAWTIYTKDPEGNTIELFVDTPWYVPQPFLEPFDLDLPDDEIYARTEALCRRSPKFRMQADWRQEMVTAMGRPAVEKPFQ